MTDKALILLSELANPTIPKTVTVMHDASLHDEVTRELLEHGALSIGKTQYGSEVSCQMEINFIGRAILKHPHLADQFKDSLKSGDSFSYDNGKLTRTPNEDTPPPQSN